MKPGRFASILLVTCLAANAASARAGELDDALGAFKKGDYKGVIAAAAKVDAASADRPKIQYLAGEAQLVIGQAAEAEGSFRAVLAARNASVPARVGLGRALTALGKLDEAEKELRAAIASDAKDAGAQRALGDALIAANKLKEARTALDEAAKLSPGDPWIARSQVELAFKAEDDKDAARIAKGLSKAKPDHPMGPFLSAIVFEREGKVDEAIDQYEKALALDDTFLDAHKNLAILCHTMSATYSNTARVEKSLAHYERYFTLGGKDPALENAYQQMKSFSEPMLKKDGGKKNK